MKTCSSRAQKPNQDLFNEVHC